MGNFNYKNICLQIKTKENLTDRHFIDFMQNWDFTKDDYIRFYESVKGNIFNPTSKKIIDFFMNYREGVLKPDKCGTYDPLKHTFKSENVSEYQSWLSFPAGCLILKKNRSYTAEIKNRYWGLSWSGKEPLVTKPQRKLSPYLGKITFWFPKKKQMDIPFYETIVIDFCKCLDTDYGIIFDQEDDRILFDLLHPQNVGTIIKNVTFD